MSFERERNKKIISMDFKFIMKNKDDSNLRPLSTMTMSVIKLIS